MMIWVTLAAEEAMKRCNGKKKLDDKGYWDGDDFCYWVNKAGELGLIKDWAKPNNI